MYSIFHGTYYLAAVLGALARWAAAYFAEQWETDFDEVVRAVFSWSLVAFYFLFLFLFSPMYGYFGEYGGFWHR